MTPVRLTAAACGAVLGAWVLPVVGWWPGVLWAPLITVGTIACITEAADWAERHDVNGWTEHDDDWQGAS